MAARVSIGLLVVLALVTAAPTARSASPAEQAESLVRSGLKDARRGKFDAAAEKFEQAVKLDPQPVYIHNLARAYQKQGKLAQAFRWFTEALERDSDYTYAKDARRYLTTIEKELRKTHARVRIQSTPSGAVVSITDSSGSIEKLLKTPVERWVPAGDLLIEGRKPKYLDAQVKDSVAAGEDKTIKVRLEPEPMEGYLQVLADAPNAVVYLDGKEIGPAPLNNHVVTSGSYELEVRAEGYETFKKTVVVVPDQSERVVARMVLLQGAGGGEGGSWFTTERSIGVALIGTGGAALIAGIVLHVFAFDAANEAIAVPACPNPNVRCAFDDEFDGLEEDALNYQIGAFVSYGVAAVLVGVGVVLTVVGEPEGSGSVEVTEPTFVPTVTPLKDGAAVGGTFRF